MDGWLVMALSTSFRWPSCSLFVQVEGEALGRLVVGVSCGSRGSGCANSSMIVPLAGLRAETDDDGSVLVVGQREGLAVKHAARAVLRGDQKYQIARCSEMLKPFMEIAPCKLRIGSAARNPARRIASPGGIRWTSSYRLGFRARCQSDEGATSVAPPSFGVRGFFQVVCAHPPGR